MAPKTSAGTHPAAPAVSVPKRLAAFIASKCRSAPTSNRRAHRSGTMPYIVAAAAAAGASPSVTPAAAPAASEAGVHGNGSAARDPNALASVGGARGAAAGGSAVLGAAGGGNSSTHVHGGAATPAASEPKLERLGQRAIGATAIAAAAAATDGPVPNMLLLPVAVCKTITLAPQATLADGAIQLLRRLPAIVVDHAALPSGVLRVEVGIPRTATTALLWLSGQQHHQQQQQGGAGPANASPAAGGPFLYFSGRRSSAPDTPGATAAEAATRGWSSLAGAGAALRWWGPGGGGFDSRVVSALQRFLSPDQPRVRILGGARFDPRRPPDPEWAAFGSHCFVLPLLELMEAEDCCLLAVTLAWDPAVVEAAGGGQGFSGCVDLATAAVRAEAALRHMRPPAPASAYGLRVSRSEPRHSPSKSEWDAHMAALLGVLQEAADTGAPAAAAVASLLDPGLARQEYLTHGQQGLDDLLAAMTAPASAGANDVRYPADGDVGDGLDALRDLIDGKATVAQLAGAAAQPPPRPAATAAAAGPVAAAAAPASAPGGPEVVSEVEALSKVVMARRTSMRIEGQLDPLHVLLSLQERDPRAYQLYFAPGTGFGAIQEEVAAADGATASPRPRPGPGPVFLACTPERLYARTGWFVTSEAVAGTRPRGLGGDVEQDFWLSLELLRSAKDHAEFCTVRDWIAAQLAGPCEDVRVEIRKSVLKQGSVQHLFGRVAARLRRGRNDAHLLAALHPTPAVCGRPREAALGYLDELESFDRGWYAGPFGWISGAGAEFVVAIRSGLVCPETSPETRDGAATNGAAALLPPLPAAAPPPGIGVPGWLLHMFAGVGVVRGSDPSAEWQELDLKIRPLSSALLPAPTPSSAPNVNVAWASLLVEELCRLGVNMFCVAPGSRSSPLTHAIALHPRARLNVCIDERSLGFWALGYGRAAGRPAAVVTSSGTAVANLLPAVVEASTAGVPLLLLTADRPAELRDTAANQTIDQAKIFGGYVRWFFDLPPPAHDVPGRTVLTAASTAFRSAVASPLPGPVHLNLQFREPLAPVAAPWSPGPFMAGLAQWQASQLPYTLHIAATSLPGSLPPALPSSSVTVAAIKGFGVGADGYGIGGADVAALQALLACARRGLVVVGELTDPRDIVAARQIGAVLGWPVVADVLSGLRVGAATAARIASAPATAVAAAAPLYPSYDNAVPIVHHMDHLLLGDRGWWRQLAPDVVLQMGPHLTSKRLGQFMDWAAMGGEGAAAVPWVYVASHTLRHDPSHLVSHRAVMTLMEFRDAVVAPAAAAASSSGGGGAAAAGSSADPWVHVSAYGRMLLQLDEAVSHEIDAAMSCLDSISEPFIARTLARTLPPGHGLFIGNSMPIRDMDMYAVSAEGGLPQPPAAASPGAAATTANAGPGDGSGGAVGVPVAANRGASGIDGVLSTAAGFAEGLSRPATLLVGDLSFLHDINGLNLLRAGELRPPLTTLLINNSGGGIFSFLPIAASVPDEEFTPLWATPQNVDLEAMCRAQGIPHQKVTTPDGLVPALQAAWGLNRHSVVEVITDRTTNVELHRRVQAAALRAARHCHWVITRMDAATTAAAALRGTLPLPRPVPSGSAPAAASGQLRRHLDHLSHHHNDDDQQQQQQHNHQNSHRHVAAAAGDGSSSRCGAALSVGELHWRRYSLPLTRPLTTSTSTAAMRSGAEGVRQYGVREGLLLRLVLVRSDGSVAGAGVGEVAPLPGLHMETLEEAEVQVAALSSLLPSVPLPPSLALLGGRITAWLHSRVGLQPAWLTPAVRFGLEGALLTALADAMRGTLTDVLAPQSAAAAPRLRRPVLLNGLLSPPVSGDDEADAAAAAAAAAVLVSDGYTAIKVKVARRPHPEADARVLAAVRAAVGPHVVLRADANRGWSGLQEAVAFGRAVAAAGVGLQYVEEPTADPRDMAGFVAETGVPVAADESLDEGLLMGPPASDADFRSHHGGLHGTAAGSYSAAGLPAERTAGLAAVVVKPAVVGGLEAAMGVVRWARRRGVRAVVSSAFESSVGLATLLQLAAAMDADEGSGGGDDDDGGVAVHHGLGTLQWFAADVAVDPLQVGPQLLPPAVPVAAAVSPAPSLYTAAATAAAAAAGGEFVPVQALCGAVEEADRLLRDCASGRGLQRHVLVGTAAGGPEALSHRRHGDRHHQNIATTNNNDRDGHPRDQTNTTAAPYAGASKGTSTRAERSGSCSSGGGDCASDPWVGPEARGGLLERQILLEVTVPSGPATTTAAAGGSAAWTSGSLHARPHPQQGQQQHANSPCVPQVVTVRGIELLPPSHQSEAEELDDGAATSHRRSADASAAASASTGNGTSSSNSNGAGSSSSSSSGTGSSSSSSSGAHGRRQSGRRQRRPFMFLHGFLGSSSDWLPLMRALSAAGHRCVALDLPGHGGTVPQPPLGEDTDATAKAATAAGPAYGIPGAAACVSGAARQLGLSGAVLVGYSLGARVALQAAVDGSVDGALPGSSHGSTGLSNNNTGIGNGAAGSGADGASLGALWSGLVLVSGTPGIKDPAQAAARAANDDRLAASLLQGGLQDFVRRWYEQPLWASLRRHPAFSRMLERRGTAASASAASDGTNVGGASMPDGDGSGDGPTTTPATAQLAAALRGMSTGRMTPLWDRLDPWIGPPVVLVVGELDAKFVDINTYTLARLVRQRTSAAAAQQQQQERLQEQRIQPQSPEQRGRGGMGSGGSAGGAMGVSEQLKQLGHALVRVEGAGHAVHVEAPERLLGVLREALYGLEGEGDEGVGAGMEAV